MFATQFGAVSLGLSISLRTLMMAGGIDAHSVWQILYIQLIFVVVLKKQPFYFWTGILIRPLFWAISTLLMMISSELYTKINCLLSIIS